jgi:hypothetical protein
LVDYEPSPEHMDINVVYLSADGDFVGDDEGWLSSILLLKVSSLRNQKTL